MELELGLLIVLTGSALCAAIGGSVASLKHRPPLGGCLLGATLGPVGIILVCRQPFAHRPVIDQGAWESFRSVVEHQSSREAPQLAAIPVRTPRPMSTPARQRSA